MVRLFYRCNAPVLFSLLTTFAVSGFFYSIQFAHQPVHAQESSSIFSKSSSSNPVSEENDAGLFLSREVVLGDRRLKAYSVDKIKTNKALVPGLARIASHVQRERISDIEKSYSLADAMADALWRKQVVDSLYRNQSDEDILQ